MTCKIKSTCFLVLFLLVPSLCLFSCSGADLSDNANNSDTNGKTRNYLVTGRWYPASKAALTNMLDSFFAKVENRKIQGKITGLIGPHAGLNFSGPCAAHAYKQLQQTPYPVERVFLLGISHRGRFHGACVSDFAFNSTPLGSIPVDREITAALAKEKLFTVDNTIMQYEHSLENHLPFLQYALKGKSYKIIPILFGYLAKEDYAVITKIIKKYINDRTIVIASSDFTHYGKNFNYTPFSGDVGAELSRLDQGMIDRIIARDFKKYWKYKKDTGITMCGFAPVGILMKLFRGKRYQVQALDYYKSGDTNNDYSFSVSYASLLFTDVKYQPEQPSPSPTSTLSQKEKETLLAIARETLELYLEKRSYPEGMDKRYDITKKLSQPAGVFVTLRIKNQLRGCIGSIVGSQALYLEVRDNAVKSALKDFRFRPVEASELKKIHIEISVMTPLQKIDNYKKIRLGTDGVIIIKDSRRAVFLPQVATETGWSLDRFLENLCRKAFLPSDAYKKPGMEFYIFQAQVFGEKE